MHFGELIIYIAMLISMIAPLVCIWLLLGMWEDIKDIKEEQKWK